MNETTIVTTLLGLIGTVLAWLMGRVERKLNDVTNEQTKVTHSIDRFSKTILIEVISRPGVSLSVTREAEKLLEEMRFEKGRL